jgi:DNA (cytosine-5)-methyltransferase 1
VSAKKLTVGSLFSGIGGLDLGLERAGMEIVWQPEIDAYASAVLRKHWLGVPNLGDIRNIRNPPAVDVLCGGFPCQDISFAGKGAGIEGERSGLWREYARIIGEVRPRFVFVENVAALLGRGLGRVLGDLAALGFDAEWHCIPASAVGAPHRRDRLWVIAYADGERGGEGRARAGVNQERRRGDAEERGPYVADSNVPRLEGRLRVSLRECAGKRIAGAGGASIPDTDGKPSSGAAKSRQKRGYWITEPDVGRVAHGVPARVDRLRALGNAIVPQIAEILGRAIVSAA